MRIKLCYANWHELNKIPDDHETFLSVVMGGETLLDEEFYDHVHSCEMMCSSIEACNELFEQFNFGDRGGHKVRSMSVGDIVIIDYDFWKEVYVCQPKGWRKLDLDDPANVRLVGSLLGWDD